MKKSHVIALVVAVLFWVAFRPKSAQAEAGAQMLRRNRGPAERRPSNTRPGGAGPSAKKVAKNL